MAAFFLQTVQERCEECQTIPGDTLRRFNFRSLATREEKLNDGRNFVGALSDDSPVSPVVEKQARHLVQTPSPTATNSLYGVRGG